MTFNINKAKCGPNSFLRLDYEESNDTLMLYYTNNTNLDYIGLSTFNPADLGIALAHFRKRYISGNHKTPTSKYIGGIRYDL